MPKYDIDDLDNRSPAAIRRAVNLTRGLLNAFKPVVKGLERLPKGPALLVGNHSGGTLIPDSFILGQALFDAVGVDEMPYGLGHQLAISLPILHHLVVPLGAVRACHANAHALFERGNKVLVYPGGDLDSMRAFKDRNRIVFGPRRGYLRLALRENVPIVTVVAIGGQSTFFIFNNGEWLARLLRTDRWFRIKVWPITFSLPWGLVIGPTPPHLPFPSKILIELLEPITFERSGDEAADDAHYVESCHEVVLGRMQAAMTRLAAERRAFGWKRHFAFLT